MFLFYIATAFPDMLVSQRAMTGGDVAEKLRSIGQHVPLMRVSIVLTMISFVDAVVLAVALYGLTRDEDNELAVLALACRLTEGMINAIATLVPVGLLWLATQAGATAPLDASAVNALAAFLMKVGGWLPNVAATCFAVGSTIFAYLFLRARSIPLWLAWVGVLGSALIAIALPLQLIGVLGSPVTDLMWIPIAVFEVVLGFWLLIKGVATPAVRRA
ncbi:MAG: hypothetical protein DMD26_18255 [Gemmatimonadetes bacterium]|nr:MAG: hypothetical protein DMD26_18255 [Gemmatimonadota bacterium]